MAKHFVIAALTILLFTGMYSPIIEEETTPLSQVGGGDLPFEVGESIEYELVYNWGLIWATAGWVKFDVSESNLPSGKYHFKGHGESYPRWNWFYEVNADYESHTDEELRPLIFERKGNEGPHAYNREYIAHDEGFTYYNAESEQGLWTKEIAASKETFDVISGIYHCRTLDFSNIAINETVPLSLLLDGEVFESHLRYLGQKKWKDRRSGIEYDCIVFKPKLIEGTVFKAGENMTVYVTNDEKRIPVYIETELVVGKGKVFLK